MTRAHWARLATGTLGTLVTGFAAWAADSTGWILLTLLAGFVCTSLAAEWIFRRLATPEEIRKDLEDRVRNDA